MTPAPQDEAKDGTVPQAPLEDSGTAQQLEHLGMTPEAAKTFAAFHSGRYANFHRES
jgi:hypothetical protein